MLVSYLPLFFMSYRVCLCHLSGVKPLCIIINFLVHWSIFLCSSLVQFKKGAEYLSSKTAKVFIPLIKFLLQILVSRRFLYLLRYFLLFLSSLFTWWRLLLIFPGICNPLSQNILLNHFITSIVSLILFIHYKLCTFSNSKSIYISWLKIPLVCIRAFTFLLNVLISSLKQEKSDVLMTLITTNSQFLSFALTYAYELSS